MSSLDDLPNEAFTDIERSAGVPGIVRSTGRRMGKPARVSEADCEALILRGLLPLSGIRDSPQVVHPDDDDDYSLANLRGLTPANVGKTEFMVLAEGYRVPVPLLLSALRKTGAPLFSADGWLAWDEESQSLAADVALVGYRQKGFARSTRDPTVPSRPEQARVFQLLRTSYLSSDYGKRPLLIAKEHVPAALAKQPVPFDEPRAIQEDDVHGFSLVHFTGCGDVTAVPLSSAYAEEVTIATRTGSFFRRPQFSSGPLMPSLTAGALRANGFSMSVTQNCERFSYFLRRNEGTVFQSVFEKIDLPLRMPFCTSDLDAVIDTARRISQWGAERNAKVYVTAGSHPLQSNDCFEVTTPEMYANAVTKLHEFGYTLGNPLGGNDVAVISRVLGKPVDDPHGPFAQPWKPAGG